MVLYGVSLCVLFCVCACVFCNNDVDACICVLFVIHRMMLYGLFLCDVCLCVCVLIAFV